MATLQTPGAFLGGLRVMAVDGTIIDVPDSADARLRFVLSNPVKLFKRFMVGFWDTMQCDV